jgi:hypothetical protein
MPRRKSSALPRRRRFTAGEADIGREALCRAPAAPDRWPDHRRTMPARPVWPFGRIPESEAHGELVEAFPEKAIPNSKFRDLIRHRLIEPPADGGVIRQRRMQPGRSGGYVPAVGIGRPDDRTGGLDHPGLYRRLS